MLAREPPRTRGGQRRAVARDARNQGRGLGDARARGRRRGPASPGPRRCGRAVGERASRPPRRASPAAIVARAAEAPLDLALEPCSRRSPAARTRARRPRRGERRTAAARSRSRGAGRSAAPPRCPRAARPRSSFAPRGRARSSRQPANHGSKREVRRARHRQELRRSLDAPEDQSPPPREGVPGPGPEPTGVKRRGSTPAWRSPGAGVTMQVDDPDHDRGDHRVVDVVEVARQSLPPRADLPADERQHQDPWDAAERGEERRSARAASARRRPAAR